MSQLSNVNFFKFINLCKQKILGNLEGLNITNDNDSTNFNKNNSNVKAKAMKKMTNPALAELMKNI